MIQVASPAWGPATIKWEDHPGTESVAIRTKSERRYDWRSKRVVTVVDPVSEERPRFYGVRPWYRAPCGFRRAPKPGCD